MAPLPLLLAGLALAAPSASPPPPEPVPIGAAAPPSLALEVRTAGRSGAAPRLAWETRAEDGAVVGRAVTAEWEAEVLLVPQAGGARRLWTAVTWRADAAVERIALTLEWEGSPTAVNRALELGPVASPLRLERGTPLLVQAGGLVLTGGPGLAAARVEAVSGRTRVTLLLDDAASRPFSTFETCFEHLPGPATGAQHVAWGSFDPRRPHTLARRARGEVDLAVADLFPQRGAPLLTVVPERWPAGARAAFVITDHADRTDADALRAVLFGASEPAAPRGGQGILGRGLRITRTFFVHGGRGTLDEPAVRALADALLEAGSEVALHSITDARDTREAVRAGLADAARWHPVTWIDHEPYTNCEAVSAQGWEARGRFGVRDVLAEGGIRWVWAAGDGGSGATRVYDLLGGAPDEARAAIAPFPYDARLWLFRSSMFYDRPAQLAAALSEGALEALEAARGLFVAHTYLGPSARTTHSPDHLGRLAVRDVGGGRLVIDPALDAALARVAAHVRAGRLASLTWAEAGDRLRAIAQLEVVYRADGAVEVRSHGPDPLPGLTLRVQVPPEVELSLDDGTPLAREDGAGEARIWFDLAAGGVAVLRAWRGPEPVPFLDDP